MARAILHLKIHLGRDRWQVGLRQHLAREPRQQTSDTISDTSVQFFLRAQRDACYRPWEGRFGPDPKNRSLSEISRTGLVGPAAGTAMSAHQFRTLDLLLLNQ